MSARDDGGPAYPIPGGYTDPRGDFQWPEGGMTLRDYFAAHATEFDVRNAIEDLGRNCIDYPAFRNATAAERIAIARHACADAMLKARQS